MYYFVLILDLHALVGILTLAFLCFNLSSYQRWRIRFTWRVALLWTFSIIILSLLCRGDQNCWRRVLLMRSNEGNCRFRNMSLSRYMYVKVLNIIPTFLVATFIFEVLCSLKFSFFFFFFFFCFLFCFVFCQWSLPNLFHGLFYLFYLNYFFDLKQK